MSKALDDPRIRRGMEAQLELRRARLAAGARPIGWKVGFGTPAAMEKLQTDAPLVGFLTDAGLLPSRATVSLAGWVKPVAEPEIAVYMGRDLAAGADRQAVQAAIAALGPAIELADLDPSPDNVEAILSGNIFHRHVILGPQDSSRAGARLDGLTGRVSRRGGEIAAVTELEANTGEIVEIVRHVADLLAGAGAGERLKAGDVIIAGSVVPPLFLDQDDDVIAFALDPIGSASVRFV